MRLHFALPLAGILAAQVLAADAALRIAGFDSLARPRLSQANASNLVARLEWSSNLADWAEVARLQGPFQRFPDLTPATGPTRFYRTYLTPRSATDDWKHHAVFPTDPLLSPEPGWGRFEPRWLKFAILLSDPHRVVFQDSTRYPFHYDFAVTRLEPFKGMSRSAFDAVSLRRTNQQVVLGAVLFAPGGEAREIAVQFVGLDPYPREAVAEWFERVAAVIEAPPEARIFYFPTFEQQAVAAANREFFASHGITVGSAARWVSADECYATGWALGRLVFVPAAELHFAYADGRLRTDDILLLDAVPAEIPPVAGVIALTPATPNSHVAILAQSFGIPFGYFASEAERTRLQSWHGQEVVLRIEEDFWGCRLKAVNVHGRLNETLRAELLALKRPPPLNLPARQPRGQLSVPVDGLRPADIVFVGGKAANLGLLRRSIPTNSPAPALAFTFDLWDGYLDQVLPGGKTLRATVAERLAGFTWPPDVAALRPALAGIRDLFTDTADFSPGQKQALLGVLTDAGFAPDRKIRFRSSTNVEDSEQFNGAGLYDSFSGCLADDLDADTAGPSVCEPAEPRERGVFRALRKVYASFYNDNAYLERLRHGVDESKVGMAVLVHHSTPDEFELANGVATVEVDKSQAETRWITAHLVTQAGAVSVTNPDSTAVPERVMAQTWNGNPAWLDFQRASSLVPLGAKVLAWESDYHQLVGLLDRAAKAFEAEFPAKRRFTLDFEYKQVAPEGALRVKQIREVPRPPAAGAVTPWLLSETNRWTVFQGEYGDVFANHRLKSVWGLHTADLRLVGSNLVASPLRRIEATMLAGFTITNRADAVSSLPDHESTRDAEGWLDRWTWGEGDAQQRLQLRTSVPTELPPGSSPLVFLSDGRVELKVIHARAQPLLTWTGEPASTVTDQVILAPAEAISPRSLRQTRVLTAKGIRIETAFYWPPNPTGPVAGYTAPVQAWIETRITGLTAQPIILRDEFAQTYRPGHHNFSEDFVFDPHLEPGLDPAILAELTARNIRAVTGTVSFDQTQAMWLWGLDDSLRRP